MTAQRLSALESAFLGLESRDVPFVYACILELDRPIAVDALRDHVGAALAHVPRYRQHVEHRRGRRRTWVERDFRIARHIHTAWVSGPGGERELEQLAAQVLASELSPGHPPWRMWTVHGLAGGRGAVIALVHHSLVDGVAGVRLLEYILRAPSGGEAEAPAEARRPRPHRRRHLLRRLLRWKNATALVRLLREGISPASEVGLNPHHVGRARVVASHTVPLADIQRIEHAFGVTNNDVVLATVSGALHRFLLRRGLEPRVLDGVRAMVPVGRHQEDPRAVAGNEVVLLLVHLPVREEDPLERLNRVASRTTHLKGSHQVGGGELLVAMSELTTPALLTNVLRVSLAMRAFNILVTNVPGPRTPLSLLGARLERIVPIVNLWPHQAVAIAVASYAGTLTFGLQADRRVVSERDLAALRDDLAAELATLVDVATHAHAA